MVLSLCGILYPNTYIILLLLLRNSSEKVVIYPGDAPRHKKSFKERSHG